ncbi:polysaccharide pyruvyl transferase family protein [Lentibacillus songyuanensis]|uniref:polysaccharide pyruvyl transferase family protein n=1 Tax=Lentibacillus songyuanensis TaxID=3136161 RepID=UPI0031B9EEB9
MKVYTITCHDVYNHGASLQAYALMKYLTACGHNVEIIDYKPDYLSNHYKLSRINHPHWENNKLKKVIYLAYKLPGRLRGLQRKRAFDTFTSTYMIRSRNRYCSNEELKKHLPPADAYICGSDQIWNSLYENGKDPAFYLDFAPEDKIKVSYAASFATDTISAQSIPFVQKHMKRLNHISVREKSGVEIVKSMNISGAVNVVDPVLLLNEIEWNLVGNQKFTEDYILVYDFDNSRLIKDAATELAKATGYKIYSINPLHLKYADKQFTYAGPDVFVSIIRDAKFVISNSFHAAVFSVIYKKNFVIVNREESINTRMRDFLQDLDLNDRLINKSYNLQSLMHPINYQRRQDILTDKILFSKRFLCNMLLREKVEVSYAEEGVVCN